MASGKLFAAAAMLVTPALAPAQAIIWSEDFDTDVSANWTVNNGPSDEAHNFFFDYSSVGIPSAPNATGSTTRGVKLQANLANGVFSGMSVSPTGETFSGDYILKFDWWANFNGPFPAGGNGSTNLSTFGIGTAGTSAQWPGGVQDSIWFAATGDGGSSIDWRAYSPAAPTGYTPASGVFAAGTDTSPDARNNTHPYYVGFGGETAPAQELLFPQQSGATAVGSAGMTWHQVEIMKAGADVTWTVDGVLIATVPVSADGTPDGNIFFGHSDINATSSTDPNDVHLLFTLIDNARVTEVPEPSTLALLSLGGPALLARRRRTA